MARCEYCGRPVAAGRVYHGVCWETFAVKKLEKMCENYCRVPGMSAAADAEMRRELCRECPLAELLNRRDARWN